MVRTLGTVLVVAACVAGCGGGETVAQGGMRFVATAPPPGTQPGRGPVNLVFTDARHGFMATSGGARNVARAGFVLPTEPGEIARTTDGGATWEPLWRGRLTFNALAVRGRVVLAAGLRLAQTGVRDPEFTPRVRHTLLVSRNRGRTWRRQTLPVRGPVALQAPAPRVWLALRAGDGYERQPVLLRTDDAGRRWRRVGLPRNAESVHFATARVGLANADARVCPGGIEDQDGRRTQLWRTTDGGATWRPIAGTCAPPYGTADVDFVTPRLVFAVQGAVLRRSEDAGATWTTVSRSRARVASRVAFSDRRHGVLAESSAEAPYHQRVRLLLAETTDGGRTWTRRPLPASGIGEEFTTPEPAIAGRHVWVGHSRAGVVWHSADAGGRWTLTTAPRFLDPGSDAGFPGLIAGPGTLTVSSAAGPVQTLDGGRTWVLVRLPSVRDAAATSGRGAYVVYGYERDEARRVTATGSAPISLPAGVRSLSDVAFTSAADGILHGSADTLHVTHDGGATWTRLVRPRRSEEAGFAIAPGLIVDLGDPGLAVTIDDGASWQTLDAKLRDTWCKASRPTPSDLWITCARDAGTTLFHSGDGGRTWTRRTTDRPLEVDLGGAGPGEAWATSRNDYPASDDVSTLWHTTDGGTTWTQVWVTLPPGAVAQQLDWAVIPSGVEHDPLDACR